MFEDVFKHQKLKPHELPVYGFIQGGGVWHYETEILDGEFLLQISINNAGNAKTNLIDVESGDEYILYKTNADGSYVGTIRAAIEGVLTDVVAQCYESSLFKTDQSLMLIEYVRKTYGNELEFLWEKFPDNAVWRRADTQKWYGALLTVEGNKIGLDTEHVVEIVDLRMKPEQKDELLTKEHYYPGWHMNKKSWYTIVLDAGVSNEELCRRLDESYALAIK